MAFQVHQPPLHKLMEDTASGAIQVPDFQRGYVWEDERVRQLLVTVAVGHPLGVLLLLETGSPEIHFQHRAIEGTTPAKDAELLVLDGQQRLTSLTQAFSGAADVAYGNKRAKRRYFLDVGMAISGPEKMADAIRSMPEDGVERTNFNRDIELDLSTWDKQIEKSYFPLWELFTNSTKWAFAWAGATGNIDDGSKLNDLLDRMKNYQIPAIVLDKSTTMGAVTTVFEKVNQGGVKLTVFELLTAKFAGDRKHFEETGSTFRLRDDWDAIHTELGKHAVLKGFDSDDFLQAITLVASLHRPTATTARKDDILKLTLGEYLTWSPQVVQALLWSASFLDREHIHAPWDLPYPKQIVPLSVIRIVLGLEADAYGIHDRIRQWFWCGILGELYGGANETRFARDVEQVPAWSRRQEGANPPGTVDNAFFGQSRLLTLRSRNSAAYKGIYALLMRGHAKDWVYNQEFERGQYFDLAVDIHHIFPKAWCDKNNIEYAFRESIINKTPLAKRTNIQLSGNAPSVYRGKIRKESQASDERIDDIIRTHKINPEHLWSDNFNDFFADRAEAIIMLIEEAMGKPIIRDIGPDETSLERRPVNAPSDTSTVPTDHTTGSELDETLETMTDAITLDDETRLRGEVALDAAISAGDNEDIS